MKFRLTRSREPAELIPLVTGANPRKSGTMPNPPRDNIILIGFMGSGKSSVGRVIAKRLRFQFLDTDHVVEERARATIPQIFAGPGGETAFRDRETAALESLLVGTHRH